MIPKKENTSKNNSFLGKKRRKKQKPKDNYILKESEKSSFLTEISTELSSDNLISFDGKKKSKEIIHGFDDLIIPAFLNDFKINKNVDETIKNYYKMKEELGSSELVELYLLDINRLIEEKRKSKCI